METGFLVLCFAGFAMEDLSLAYFNFVTTIKCVLLAVVDVPAFRPSLLTIFFPLSGKPGLLLWSDHCQNVVLCYKFSLRQVWMNTSSDVQVLTQCHQVITMSNLEYFSEMSALYTACPKRHIWHAWFSIVMAPTPYFDESLLFICCRIWLGSWVGE